MVAPSHGTHEGRFSFESNHGSLEMLDLSPDRSGPTSAISSNTASTEIPGPPEPGSLPVPNGAPGRTHQIQRKPVPIAQHHEVEPETSRFHQRIGRRYTALEGFVHRQSWWPEEVLAWITSLILFVVIAVILAVYDGKQSPVLQWGIRINTVVAVLAAFATVFLMVPLGASLGQAKWNRLVEPRTLHEFHLISQAGKGPQNSLGLLFRWKGGLVAIFCTLVSILTLGIGPFVQQLIAFVPATIPNAAVNATLPIARSGLPHTLNSFDSVMFVNPETKSAFYNGLYTSSRSTYDIPTTCSSPRCTWEPYLTFAICSSCQNMTTHLHNAMDNSGGHGTFYNWTLQSSGLFLDQGGIMSQTIFNSTASGLDLDKIMSSSADHAPMLKFTAIALQNASTTPIATECTLQVCLKQLSAVQENGRFTETTIGSPITEFTNDHLGTYTYKTTSTTNYTVDAESVGTWSAWLRDLVTGSLTALGDGSGLISEGSDELQQLYHSVLAGNGSQSIDNIFANVADSFSRAIRIDQNYANVSVNGTTYTSVVLVQVSWPWIILPLFIEVTTLVLLLWTIADTHRKRMWRWRDSSLATLFHGIEDAERLGVAKLLRNDAMEDRAKDVAVRLKSDDNGWRLVPVDGV